MNEKQNDIQKIAPCYKCDERKMNCHSECDKYKKYLLKRKYHKIMSINEKQYD